MDNGLHLASFGFRRMHALPRLVHAHHIEPQWVERHQSADIDAQWMLGQAVHPLRKRLPVPAQTLLHRAKRDRFDARQEAHRSLLILWFARSKAEPALPDRHRGDPVPPRHRRIRVPVQLQIVMVVQIDSPGRNKTAAGVYFFLRGCLDAAADRRDLPVLDRQIPAVGRYAAGPVHDRAIADYQIVLGHFLFPPQYSGLGIVADAKQHSPLTLV